MYKILGTPIHFILNIAKYYLSLLIWPTLYVLVFRLNKPVCFSNNMIYLRHQRIDHNLSGSVMRNFKWILDMFTTTNTLEFK